MGRVVEWGKDIASKVFICPYNDLESKTIIEMLDRNEADYMITNQGWGASWENLEDNIKQRISKLNSDEFRIFGKEIYGIELQGKMEGTINIDHHKYWNDDRSNSQSSIEQVAEILGVELTLDEMFVAANDKGFIPEMEKLGQELGILKEDMQAVIQNIRYRDREAQGITKEQEEQAQSVVDSLGEITEKQKLIDIDLPHSKTATITDRLYGKYENLLIISSDGETNFYGTTEMINKLNEQFPGGWSGGQLDQGSGFWGGYADQVAIRKLVRDTIEPTIPTQENDKKDDVSGEIE